MRVFLDDEHPKISSLVELFFLETSTLRLCARWAMNTIISSSWNIRLDCVWLFFFRSIISWNWDIRENDQTVRAVMRVKQFHPWITIDDDWGGGDGRRRVSSPLINFSWSKFSRWRYEMVTLTTQQQKNLFNRLMLGLVCLFFPAILVTSYIDYIERGQVSPTTTT